MPIKRQPAEKVLLKNWRRIDWENECEYTFCYGDSGRVRGLAPDECVLEHWESNGTGIQCNGGGILTYYKLPPIIQRIIRDALRRGKDEAKEELKNWLKLRSRFKG